MQPSVANDTGPSHEMLRPGFFVEKPWVYVLGPLAITALFVAYHFTGHFVFLHLFRASLLGVATLAFLAICHHPGTRTMARIALYFAVCFLFYRVAQRTADALAYGPSEWDFLCFFLDGNVAAAGLNLYQPDSYVQMVNKFQLTVSEEFHRELLQVGFKYPPPTVMLFMPLSLFDMYTGHVLWISLIAAMVIVATLLLSRLLAVRDGGPSEGPGITDWIALVGVLVMSIPPTRTAISMGQTTPILCSFIVLALLGGGRFPSGIAAALSAFVKPLAAIPALVLLIGRYWAAVLAGLVTGALLLAASLFALGTDDWTAYLRQEYATTAPAWIYYEPINQSLLGTLVRLFGSTEVPWGTPSIVWTYAALSLVIAVTSLWLAARTARKDYHTAYCLLLLVALLVYPGTQTTYGMLLAVPMAIEFHNQLRAREHEFIIIFFVVTTVALFGLGMFAANVFVWLILLRRSLILCRPHAGGQQPIVARATT